MKLGVVGGIAGCFLVVASWSAVAVDVYVNDLRVALSPPVLVEGDSVLVPVEAFAPTVGVETKADDERLILRWRGGRRDLALDRCAMRQGTAYVALEWIVELVSGEIHRVGQSYYVETSIAALESLEASAERVVVRLDGFAPISIDASDRGDELLVRVAHCGSRVEPQLIVLGEEGIRTVRLLSGTPHRVDLWIALEEGAAIRTETFECAGFYSFCLEISDRPGTKASVQVDAGLSVHELSTVLSTERIEASWVYAEAWRDRFRLAPALPPAGLEAVASVEELAASAGAVAAVNLGCSRAPHPVDLLVLNGTPYIVDGETHSGLGLDLFGWWIYFSGSASIAARHAGGRIPIDDVNRPLLYGEVIAYCPGYSGAIARGVPGSFLVVKTRSGRVVSVYEGPFVTADPTATLIVASGEAKARMSLVRLGDAVALECGIGSDAATFAHAFSAGPVLVDSGVPAEPPATTGEDAPNGWVVVATDWHGGLTLLTFTRERGSEREVLADLSALLASMSAPIRDAIVLSRCSESVLVVRSAALAFRIGSGDPHALALCLVPLSP